MRSTRKVQLHEAVKAGTCAGLCILLFVPPLASGQMSSKSATRMRTPIHISVLDGAGVEIAASSAHASSASSHAATLAFEREYQPSDHIVFRGPRRIAVRVSESIPECLLYLSNSSDGRFTYEVPSGKAEQQTGSAYAPESFSGKAHRLTARPWNESERTGYRNLALNPCDLLEPQDGPATFFPHSSTNSYSRNLYDFAARNAIDGVSQNGHHGSWPYQSWGPGLRLDLWWKLDFGRPVDLDKIRVMVRADFPHDSYWKSAVVEFSDGSLLPIQMTASPDFQEFQFPKRSVTWFRITNLVPDDPARWCSFIEVEAWGHDLP